ncbi:MAG: class I SAM-dependent methyltransferase [Gammaproteobacteria bacterium]|nr:class I SAM-dependent methyltransferase [Gammaproteobacteria bacterium]
MFFKKSPEKFWDLISSKYAASPIVDQTAYQKKINKLKSWLPAESVVLDIGCGTGTQCLDLAAHIKQATGIDISKKLLAIAEQRKAERKLSNVEFLNTSLFDERFQPASFDVVMAFYVLHFFKDIDAVFNRVHALLKPGGLFIFETACLGEQNKLLAGLLRLLCWIGFLPFINMLNYRQLQQALDKAGFSLIEKTRFSDAIPEYTLIARKNSEPD